VIRQVAVAEDKARRFWQVKETVSVQVRDAHARRGLDQAGTSAAGPRMTAQVTAFP
jgi:hypothetical protein